MDNEDFDARETDEAEYQRLEKIKENKNRIWINTAITLYCLYGLWLAQHLMEEHHAGHHVLFFILQGFIMIGFILYYAGQR